MAYQENIRGALKKATTRMAAAIPSTTEILAVIGQFFQVLLFVVMSCSFLLAWNLRA